MRHSLSPRSAVVRWTFAAIIAVFLGRALDAAELVISVAVTDKQGKPVPGLTAADFDVRENGETRQVTRAELDRRPLRAALVLDSSAVMATAYQMDVVPAASALLQALPEDAIVDVWTTGGHPGRVVSGAVDHEDAVRRVRDVAAFGRNAVLETIEMAAAALGEDEQRAAVIVFTSGTSDDPLESGQMQSAVHRISKRPTFACVEAVAGSAADHGLESALRELSSRTAGYFEQIFAAGALRTQVPRILDALNAQYRLAWEPAHDPRSARLEFNVTRKGLRATAAQRLSTRWQ